MVDRNQGKREDFVVEMVTLQQDESSSSGGVDDSVDPLDSTSPRPLFPIGPETAPSQFQNDAPQPDSSSVPEEKEGGNAQSPFSQEEERGALPEGPTGLSEPDLSTGGMGEGEIPQDGNDGPSGGGDASTADPAAPPGAIGGGRIAPSFVTPRSDGRFNPKPRYPEKARSEGREGTVLLKVTVLPTGEVGEAVAERSSGHADLDRSAVEAVKKWTFSPARRGESPVIASVRIPVTFALDHP